MLLIIVSFWNCRGAGHRTFPRLVKEVVKKYQITVLGLAEPRISGDRADQVCTKLGFSYWVRVEATGYAGEIWVLWNKKKVEISYLSSSTQSVHCEILELASKKTSCVTFIYGDTSPAKRNQLWVDLRVLARSMRREWLVLGDFNTYMWPQDKAGALGRLTV